MARQRNRQRQTAAAPSPFEQARDELFQHVMRCGVIGAAPEHQKEWFDDTMAYITDRYPELGEGELGDLRTLGERFSQPPKKRTDEESLSAERESSGNGGASDEESEESAEAVDAASAA